MLNKPNKPKKEDPKSASKQELLKLIDEKLTKLVKFEWKLFSKSEEQEYE